MFSLATLQIPCSPATAETIDGPAPARKLDENNLLTLGLLSESTTEEPGVYWNFRTAQDETGVWTTYYGAKYLEGGGGFTPPSRFAYDNGIDVLWYYGFTHWLIFYGEDSALIISWGPALVCVQNVFLGGEPK